MGNGAARDGQIALALRLAKHLAPAADDDDAGATAATSDRNVAFSPLSVHAALALVATAGARGATQAQLLAFLGAPSAAELAEFGCRVADSVLATNRPACTDWPRVLCGGGVWVDAACGRIKKAFRDVATECYKSEARIVSFAKEPEKAVQMINDSVKKATWNIITSIIFPGDINAATDIVLADAVYFRGAWLSPFSSYATKEGTFHRLDDSCVTALFMYHHDYHHVSIMDGFKVLQLRYKNGPIAASASRGANGTQQYSMFVFLPDKRGGIATMVDVITASPGYLRSVLPGSETTKLVSVKLPKFQIAFDWDLGSDLRRRLGLSLPFSPEVADLRDVCEKDYDGRPTILSKFAHSAVVKVNEAGTGAAATAAVPVRNGGGAVPDKVEFVADHPFTFLVMEERSGVIVFAGHVLDPTS